MINPTNAQNIQSMLSQIRSYQSEASQGINISPDVAGVSEGREASGFGNTIKTAL